MARGFVGGIGDEQRLLVGRVGDFREPLAGRAQAQGRLGQIVEQPRAILLQPLRDRCRQGKPRLAFYFDGLGRPRLGSRQAIAVRRILTPGKHNQPDKRQPRRRRRRQQHDQPLHRVAQEARRNPGGQQDGNDQQQAGLEKKGG